MCEMRGSGLKYQHDHPSYLSISQLKIKLLISCLSDARANDIASHITEVTVVNASEVVGLEKGHSA